MNTLAVPPKVNTSESNVPITFKHKLETKDPTTFFSHLCDLYDSKDPHHFLIEYLGRFCSNVSNGLLNANVAIKLPKHRDDWFEISWTDPGWTSDDVKRWLEYIHDSTGKMDNISRKHEGGRSVLAAMMARHKDACEMRIKVIEDTELPKGRNNLGDNIMHKGWYLYTYNGDHQGWREPNGEFIGEDPNRENRTYLKMKLNEVTFNKIIKNKKRMDGYLLRCFNKTNVKINYDGREIICKPILPDVLPENNETYKYRRIKFNKTDKCMALIKKDYLGEGCKNHKATWVLKIGDVSLLGTNNMRNIELIEKIKNHPGSLYFLCQNAPTFKVLCKRKMEIYNGNGDARNYWIIPEEYIIIKKISKLPVDLSYGVANGKKEERKKNIVGADMFIDYHIGNKSKFSHSSDSTVGIFIYTNDIMIRTDALRWKQTGEGSLDRSRWYCPQGTAEGNNRRGQKPKYLPCQPICEINQHLENQKDQDSLYKCDNGLKNETQLKDNWFSVFKALNLSICETFLYDVRPGWRPIHESEIITLDDKVKLTEWQQKEAVKQAKKLIALQKKAEQERKEKEKERLAKIEAEKIAKQERLAKMAAKEQAQVNAQKAEVNAQKAEVNAQEAEDVKTENELLKEELTKAKAAAKEDDEPEKLEIKKSAVYFFSDPTRPKWFKVGHTEQPFERLKNQSRYGPNQFPFGINWHSYNEINTYGINKYIAEKLLHNRFHALRQKHPETKKYTEWFIIPNNYDIQFFIDDTIGFLKDVQKMLTPL